LFGVGDPECLAILVLGVRLPPVAPVCRTVFRDAGLVDQFFQDSAVFAGGLRPPIHIHVKALSLSLF
jgi:hypothetical protein